MPGLDGLQGEPGEPGRIINGIQGEAGQKGEYGFNGNRGLPGLDVSSNHDTYSSAMLFKFIFCGSNRSDDAILSCHVE